MVENQRSRSFFSNPLAVVLLLSGAFFALFLVISAALFFTRDSGKTSASKGAQIFKGGKGGVGVVELNGVILESKKILKRLEEFEDDSRVKAVVLRLNSPGGAVAPSQEIYQAVQKFSKPLVVSMGSVAASGAYYIACGAKKVFANPGTITGSIGVIMEFINLEKLYEWAKVRRYAVKTGKFKDVGAEYKEMAPEEKELLQGMVDDVLAQFKQAVVDGRKLPLEEVTLVADGRIFSGAQAKEKKLVDELGTLQDAIDEAAKLAKISGKPKVIYPERKMPRLWETLLNDGFADHDEDAEASTDLVSLLLNRLRGVAGATQLTAPGVYWLWTGSR